MSLWKRILDFSIGIAPQASETFQNRLQDELTPTFNTPYARFIDSLRKRVEVQSTNKPDETGGGRAQGAVANMTSVDTTTDETVTDEVADEGTMDEGANAGAGLETMDMVAAAGVKGDGKRVIDQALQKLQKEGLIPKGATWKIGPPVQVK